MNTPRGRAPSRLKTFSHLSTSRRVPSEYELVTSRLLPHIERGALEVETPVGEWQDRYQRHSSFRVDDWDAFADPRRTTYTTYTAMQRDQEAHVDALLETIEQTGYDARLDAEARSLLERTIPVLRFPVHGLQMLAAYFGQVAPSGRVTIAAAFQAADEVRRTQRFAYRMALLAETFPGFGERSRESWQSDVSWQPLRRLIELALVTYDWGEAFAATCLCIKPLFDEVCNVHLAAAAERYGDPLFSAILHSIHRDATWHRSWSEELVRFAIEARPDNRRVLASHMAKWQPLAIEAADSLDTLIGRPKGETALGDFADASVVRLGLSKEGVS